MVPTLKKLLLCSLVALYAGLSGAVSLEIKDGVTWHHIDEVYLNDSGTWRQLKRVEQNNSGTWVTSYHADIFNVTIEGLTGGNCNAFCGYSIPAASDIGSIDSGNISVLVSTPTVIVNSLFSSDAGSDSFLLTTCSESAVPAQSAFTKLLVYTSATAYIEYLTASASYSNTTDQGGDACNDLGYSHRTNWGWTGSSPWTGQVGQVRKVVLVR